MAPSAELADAAADPGKMPLSPTNSANFAVQHGATRTVFYGATRIMLFSRSNYSVGHAFQ